VSILVGMAGSVSRVTGDGSSAQGPGYAKTNGSGGGLSANGDVNANGGENSGADPPLTPLTMLCGDLGCDGNGTARPRPHLATATSNSKHGARPRFRSGCGSSRTSGINYTSVLDILSLVLLGIKQLGIKHRNW
jgi:hypothetical protein